MTENKSVTHQEALEFHQMNNKPGKIGIVATKPLFTQRDLSLAYSPGVASPCIEIHQDKQKIYDYTSKGNLVAVISNGTAVLGLGSIGAAASKPVMEGKAVLFKRFADIDAIDLEVDTLDPEEFINSIKVLSPSFGGINLEDIKAPDCFIIEEKLKELMDIPVFHDDQHGTAIITLAGLINASHITGRKFEEMKVVVNGAGAAGIACVELIKTMGIPHNNVILCDTMGVIYQGRANGMNQWKSAHAVETEARTLTQALKDADVFLGLSAKGAVTKEMVQAMAPKPIIFAMANPDPEITPEEVHSVRKDAIVATGRSDYPNQVNNVMGFPYIFRGALDVRATTINDEMKIAAAQALAKLAREPIPDEVSAAYGGKKMKFGPEYIIPVPFDPRLITTIPVAVAVAAMETGVATIPIKNISEYRKQLNARLDPNANSMNLIFDRVASNPQKIIFAEGEEEQIIKTALLWRDSGYGTPILVGREEHIYETLRHISPDYSLEGVEIHNASNSSHLDKYIDYMYQKLQRQGYLYRDCVRAVKNDRNIFAACMLACGDGNGLVSGLTRGYNKTLDDINKIIEKKSDSILFGLSMLLVNGRTIFLSDTTVNELPSAQELADITIQTASKVRKMGDEPSVALISFSNFGNPMREKAARIREAVSILDSKNVDFDYDGEMSVDVALNPSLMKLYPFCRLSKPVNTLIMPALHTADASAKLLKALSNSSSIGPILCGMEKPVQIVQMGYSVSEILNLAALAALEAIETQ
jgi:malate dehydrogenase (oxaloacetate-decarboxylating)(NADP+)